MQTKTAGQTTAQRLVQSMGNQPANEDNVEDGDYSLMSGTASIGLAGGRAMRPRSPMVIGSLTTYEFGLLSGFMFVMLMSSKKHEYKWTGYIASMNFIYLKVMIIFYIYSLVLRCYALKLDC